MCICWPHPQDENASWQLNTWTRAAMNVSNENKEKSGESKAHYCTKLKKEVCGNLFMSSCCTCLLANGSDYAGAWLSSSCHISISIAFQKLQSRFLCREMIILSLCVKKWKGTIITLGNYFGSYLRLVSSAIWLVSSWTVTYFHLVSEQLSMKTNHYLLSHMHKISIFHHGWCHIESPSWVQTSTIK